MDIDIAFIVNVNLTIRTIDEERTKTRNSKYWGNMYGCKCEI